MLAAVYYSNKDIRIVQMPRPEIGPGELLLKVMACGICGSDVTEWYRSPKAPLVLGHEATGIIENTGEGIAKFSVGDRVFVSHHVPCNKCRYCLKGHHTACETLHQTHYYPGGFAQYIRVPRTNVELGTYLLPSDMSFDEGTFIEPLACVVRGQRFASLEKDDTLLIIGSGVAGLLHLKLARSKGLSKVITTDVDMYRLKMAKQFGAYQAINAAENAVEKLKEINEGRLADKIIVCTGAAQAALTALDCVEKGGTILFFAVPDPTVKIALPITRYWRNEVTIKTSYGAAPDDLSESLSLLTQKRIAVEDMITHRFDMPQASEGFRLAAEGKTSLKVILKPNLT